MNEQQGGLVRPDVDEAGAVKIALACYGIEVDARELGSNQDRNFLLTERDGTRSVLRIDNPVFADDARDAQHAALDAYRTAGVPAAAVLPGLDGALTQRSPQGYAVRRSDFAPGEPMLDCGYLAPVVIEEFGALAAASVNALAGLEHPGLDRVHMWDMRVAHDETVRLAPSIADAELRERVLAVAEEARAALAPLAEALPVQAVHGDLTDDNVMGERGDDSRLHPRTVLDLGDLAYGWRVAEPAVTISSLLHHEPERPLRVLDAVVAFHRDAPLGAAEARALWPLVALRAALLVASGWKQLEIDGDNEYARERIAGEQAIFDAATALPLDEVTELVLAALGYQGVAAGSELKLVSVPAGAAAEAEPLRPILPGLAGEVAVLDPGVESGDLSSGAWLAQQAEDRLVDRALLGASAAVLPYGVYRLTRTAVDAADAAETWPVDTEIWLRGGDDVEVAAPADATVEAVDAESGALTLRLDGRWRLRL